MKYTQLQTRAGASTVFLLIGVLLCSFAWAPLSSGAGMIPSEVVDLFSVDCAEDLDPDSQWDDDSLVFRPSVFVGWEQGNIVFNTGLLRSYSPASTLPFSRAPPHQINSE